MKAFLILSLLALTLIFVSTRGCATQQHKRENLQLEYPDCYVFENLYIECPDPFSDFGSGFGTGVTNQKIKKKRTK